MSAPQTLRKPLIITPRPVDIPVAAAVRVVAAGLFKRREGGQLRTAARVTLVLTPVAGDKRSSTLDLVQWPSQVEELVENGVPIMVWPLGANGCRGKLPPRIEPVVFRRTTAPSIRHELVTA